VKPPEPRGTLSPMGGEPPLPPVVNIPLAVEDVTFDISIKKTTNEERSATLEEKKAAAAEQRNIRYLSVAVVILLLGFCLYEVFLANVDDYRRDFAEKIAVVLVGFVAGNISPKLIGKDTDRE